MSRTPTQECATRELLQLTQPLREGVLSRERLLPATRMKQVGVGGRGKRHASSTALVQHLPLPSLGTFPDPSIRSSHPIPLLAPRPIRAWQPERSWTDVWFLLYHRDHGKSPSYSITSISSHQIPTPSSAHSSLHNQLLYTTTTTTTLLFYCKCLLHIYILLSSFFFILTGQALIQPRFFFFRPPTRSSYLF